MVVGAAIAFSCRTSPCGGVASGSAVLSYAVTAPTRCITRAWARAGAASSQTCGRSCVAGGGVRAVRRRVWWLRRSIYLLHFALGGWLRIGSGGVAAGCRRSHGHCRSPVCRCRSACSPCWRARGLVNDATALILFSFAVGAVATGGGIGEQGGRSFRGHRGLRNRLGYIVGWTMLAVCAVTGPGTARSK